MRTFRLLAPLAALAITACSSSAQKPKGPPPISVTTTQLKRATIATYATLDGQVDPFLQSNVATEQGGTILRIYANEGDRVREGQPLAKIDDAPLRATLTQQEGAKGAADAKLSEAQTQLPITTTLYESALTQAEQGLTQAKYQQISDRANVNNTKATFVGDEQLEKQGYVAETTYEQARASYVAAQQLLAADATKITQAQAAVTEAKRNLLNARLQAQVVNENRASVTEAQGAQQLTQTQLGETVLTAPFDGVVTSRLLDPGAYASPNQAIYQISQIDPTYVDFNLKDVDLAYVHEGTQISFATSANPGRRYNGTIATINAVPTTGTLLYRARIVMRNPDYSLRGGMLVTVRVTKEMHANALVAPRDAVTQNDGKGELFTIVTGDAAQASHAKLLHVGIGAQSNTYVEIVSPDVHEGMTIVATRPDQLQDGSPVSVPH
jgi:RND family efflux transporter MFP subunit